MLKISLVAVVTLIVFPAEGIIDSCKTHDKILTEGYPAEKYDVVTEDGYVLEVNRIPHGKSLTGNSSRPVVFMMHGLGGCSNNFVDLGSEFGAAYNLADAGFDVWLGNARGVGMSRRHVSLDPDNRSQKLDFFDYSWEEIGVYDLPAMINKALEVSGQDKFYYIGHSQGGTAFLVLNSLKPEFSSKIISAHLLAAAGYHNYFPNQRLARYADYVNIIYPFARAIGFVEVNGPEAEVSTSDAAASGVQLEEILNSLLNSSYFENAASASIKQFAHYGQNVKDKQFRRWDYSTIQNLLKYRSTTPPKYDLTKITPEVTLHYTVGDTLIDEKDVLAMAQDLPNCVTRKIAKEDFTHFDFVTSPDTKSLVTEYIIEDLKRRSNQ